MALFGFVAKFCPPRINLPQTTHSMKRKLGLKHGHDSFVPTG